MYWLEQMADRTINSSLQHRSARVSTGCRPTLVERPAKTNPPTRRHLALPRPAMFAVKLVSQQTNPASGLYSFAHFGPRPWYVRPSIRALWHPMALLIRAFGGGAAGSKDDRYCPQEYDLRTIGPSPQQGKGLEGMSTSIEVIEENSLSSCPFHKM